MHFKSQIDHTTLVTYIGTGLLRGSFKHFTAIKLAEGIDRMKFKIDKNRASEVFGALLQLLREDKHPFDHSRPPQEEENMPANMPLGGVEHGLFLWAVCYYMKGGIDSDTAVRALCLMHEKSPELFSPKWVAEHAELGSEIDGLKGMALRAKVAKTQVYATLSAELKYHGLGFSLELNTCSWILNAIKIERHWGGDVRNLFEWVSTYEDLVDRIANKGTWQASKKEGFMGFQEKMVSMIAYFLQATGLIDPSRIPVPVDFHVIRILVSTEIVVPKQKLKAGASLFSKALLDKCREVTAWYAKKEGLRMIELCDALWLYSRAMCSFHPATTSQTTEKSTLRKMQQKQRRDPSRKDIAVPISRGRRAVVKPISVVWNEAQINAFNRSCRHCPVNSVCKWAVPAAPYYIGGNVVRRERTSPEDYQPHYLKPEEQVVRVKIGEWNKEVTRKRLAASQSKTTDEQIELPLD